MPAHDADTGTMLTIDDPVINWVALDDDIGSDAYGSIIGNFSESLTTTPGPPNVVRHLVCLQLYSMRAHQHHRRNYLYFQETMPI